nr:zeta toxin family protein [Pseudopedobacter sp.]
MNWRDNDLLLTAAAIEVLNSASSNVGIKASSQETDNYNRIWARDSAVSSLAILTNQITHLYPNIKASIVTLQSAANLFGQIPSNVSTDEGGIINGISFGGPVGRTDTSFWWLIMSISYLQQQPDAALRSSIYEQAKIIFRLADSWEFNGKHLMYVPMSSNWADEYVTHGYVLYDQLLRFWALNLASNYFNQQIWNKKASAIKTAIKQHYLLEAELEDSLYTEAQRKELKDFDLEKRFIASFSPGDRIEKYDTWSIGLLFLLKIPSQQSGIKLEKAINKIFVEAKGKGIPAFYPLITSDDKLFDFIKLNHHYRFKNHPGHFHNGGIWPVVNGFLISGLKISGFSKTAMLIMDALNQNLINENANVPFTEYFDFFEAKPFGVSNLCFSASGYLLAKQSLINENVFMNQLSLPHNDFEKIYEIIKAQTANIISHLNIGEKKTITISLAGESGSGKTTLAKAIKMMLEEEDKKVVLLHQDDYFKLPPQQNHIARMKDFNHVGPQEARLSLLDEHLHLIKSNQITSIEIPHMNWLNDSEEKIMLNVANVDVILVEGTYTSLLKEINKRIFINSDFKKTKQNRIIRNRETVTDFIEKVLKRENEIIQQHLKLADIVVDHEFKIVP